MNFLKIIFLNLCANAIVFCKNFICKLPSVKYKQTWVTITKQCIKDANEKIRIMYLVFI